MNRPFKYKIVKPTFEKIAEFNKPKKYVIDSKSKLNGAIIKLWCDKETFEFEFEYPFYAPANQIMQDLDNVFNAESISLDTKKYSFLNQALKKAHIRAEPPIIEGKVSSLIEDSIVSFTNKYLRFLISLEKHSNTGAIEGLVDLKTDQEVLYGGGYNNFLIDNIEFEKCHVANNGVKYQIIDSVAKTNLTDFDKKVDAILTVLSFLYGTGFNCTCYVVSSSIIDFSEIESVLFYTRDKDYKHENPIYDSHEIRSYKFSNDYFLFPKSVFNNFCGLIIEKDRLRRGLNIIFEANQNKHSLSRCILYASCIETISGLIKIGDKINPIDIDRFEKSEILDKLNKVIEDSTELNEGDKEFLTEKKIKYINTPTNPDRIEFILKHFNIELPEKFKKALTYRNYYLHGNIPKGSELGSFETDNYNRGFELHFIANIMILKYVGFRGFLKNYSAMMEYYNNKNKGLCDGDFELNQSLYYKISLLND